MRKKIPFFVMPVSTKPASLGLPVMPAWFQPASRGCFTDDRVSFEDLLDPG
jgi:hypothetical protein